MLFRRVDPKTELEGIDRAVEILNDRFQKKLISLEEFNKKSLEFGKRKAKCLKKLEKVTNRNKPHTIEVGGFLMFGDSFFKKVEQKTNVNKDTILSLADKLQKGNMKDEKVLSEVVDEIANMTGKSVSSEKKERIIKTIMQDEVPDNVDKMF